MRASPVALSHNQHDDLRVLSLGRLARLLGLVFLVVGRCSFRGHLRHHSLFRVSLLSSVHSTPEYVR